MTFIFHRDRTEPCSLRSRLEQSLLRLHRCIERTRQDETRVDQMFISWQKKWAGRREQIAHRLAMIEEQLEKIKQESDGTMPRLVVFGVPHDADEMTSMPAY